MTKMQATIPTSPGRINKKNYENDARDVKRCRLLMRDQEEEKVRIPTLYPDPKTGTIHYQEFMTAYKEYQAVFVPNIVCFNADKTNKISTWQDIVTLFQTLLPTQDQESWCLETSTSKSNTDTKESFFQSSSTNPSTKDRREYCSFLVQHDEEVVQTTLQNLPFSDFIFDDDANQHIQYGPCIWFFFGWNYQLKLNDDDNSIYLEENDGSLQGRPEHTDSVSHDATWHYQFSGSKIWKLRPTMELLQKARSAACESDSSNDGLRSWPLQQTNNEGKSDNSNNIERNSNGGIPITIQCSKGDVLIINTRLWWHQTFIPLVNHVEPSISYARDGRFFCDDNSSEPKETLFSTNLDGLFSTEDIEEDTIIFTEKDMPDCELHRSISPNCQVAQLEDGTDCVVSLKPISAGEFFSVDFSSSEEDDEEDEEEATSRTSTTSE